MVSKVKYSGSAIKKIRSGCGRVDLLKVRGETLAVEENVKCKEPEHKQFIWVNGK